MGQGTELDRLYFTVDADTSAAKKAFADLEGAAEDTGKKIHHHLDDAGNGGEKLHRGIEVSRRELLYLGREVATGDLARLPSTLALITSHLTGMTSAGILAGGAIAAPFALIGIAAYQSERAMNSLENAIRRTGAAAGVSPGALFQAITASGGGNASINQAAVLLGRGNISNTNLQGAMQASSLYGDANGMSRSKAAEDFEKILADPKKGAEELHDSMKLLTSQQIEQIDHLQRLGDKEDAQKIIIDATNNRLKDLGDQAGPVAKLFTQMADKGASWWAQFGRSSSLALGLGVETPEEKATRLGDAYVQSLQGIGGGKNGERIPAAQAAAFTAWKAALADLAKLHNSLADTQRTQAADDQRKQFLDRAREIDPKFGRAGTLSDEISLAQTMMKNARGALADPRTAGSARTGFLADIKEAMRIIAADRYGLATGKSPSQFLSPEGDPVARHQEELRQNAILQNRVAGAYGSGGIVAGRNAEIAARADEAIQKKQIYASGRGDFIASGQSDDNEKRAKQFAENVQKMQDENTLLTLHTQLMGVDEDTRNRALAIQEETNRVIEDYGDLSSDAAKKALAANLALTNAKQDQLKLQKDINNEQQAELDMAHDVTDVIEGPLKKLMGKNPLLQLLGKYAIFNPLENVIQGGVTGTPGTKPTLATAGGLFGKLFGGPGGVGGKPDGSPMNPLHVVMGAGGVGATAAGSGDLLSKILGGGTFGSSTSTGGATGILGALLHGGGIGQAGKGASAGISGILSGAASWIGNLFANGGAWGAGGVRYAADGMVLGGSTMFHTSTGPVIGGEKGMNSEALVPLARGPDGKLGVRSHGGSARGHTYINQQISIHPDVSAIARGEVMNMMPVLKTSAVEAVNEAAARGVPIGGG